MDKYILSSTKTERPDNHFHTISTKFMKHLENKVQSENLAREKKLHIVCYSYC